MRSWASKFHRAALEHVQPPVARRRLIYEARELRLRRQASRMRRVAQGRSAGHTAAIICKVCTGRTAPVPTNPASRA